MICTDFEPPIQFQSRIEKLPRWSTDDMNPSQFVKFSLKKDFNTQTKMWVQFAPAQEVMCGSAGCYAKQFQLDRFLDHLTVIITLQKICQSCYKYLSKFSQLIVKVHTYMSQRCYMYSSSLPNRIQLMFDQDSMHVKVPTIEVE